MRILFVTLIVVILDQLTKQLVKAHFHLTESIMIIGDFFRFTYIENPGMAFGLRIAGPLFFTVFSAIACIVIFYFLYRLRAEPLLPRLALALVLGGAIGNLIDRALYGKVIDFLDFGFGMTRWPIFNIADVAVSIGMVLLIAIVLFEKDEERVDDSRLPENVKSRDLPESEERDLWDDLE